MRPIGPSEYREALRHLAIQGLQEGYEVAEVAELLDVAPCSVRRWRQAHRLHGDAGLAAVPQPGRPARLTAAQQAQVLQWTQRDPRDFGLVTERWTAPRLAALIQRNFGVQYHPRYLNHWLRHHRISPQIPAPVARERSQGEVDGWLRYRWPRIRKRGRMPAPPSFSPMKVAF